MKKSLILLILILLGGGWIANKYLKSSNKSSEEQERFIKYAGNYSDAAEIYLTEQTKAHHDEAFAASYQMWQLSPISEIDLDAHYDEKTYYMTLGKIISKAAKKDSVADAYTALIDIGRHYGVPPKGKKPGSSNQATSTDASTSPSGNSSEKKESLLKKSKLGDKRTIPSRRRRDENR